jgi:hypothetical protein
LQFSVRSLMIVTLLVAVACAWFLQPPSREESLAGGKLKLWRQVKYVDATPPYPVIHGRWTLSTRAGTVLCTGYYRDDEKVGRWITYFPDGTKAAEGVLERNVRIGTWHTWHANGQMETEMEYRLSIDERNVLQRPFVRSVVPINPSSPSFGPSLSIRSGPARAWYANGNLRYEGSFADDREDGPWKYYDEQGKIISQGPFRDGLRDGTWIFTNAAGKTRSEKYVGGRTQAELTSLLSLLERKLHRRSESNRRAIAEELERLGSPAVNVLLAALDAESIETRIEAARSLARIESPPIAAIQKLRPAINSANEHERLYATAAIYALDEPSRNQLFDSLWIEVLALDTPTGLDIAQIMYRADTARRPEIFARLMEWKLGDEPTVSGQVVVCLARLPGDILPYVTAQSISADPRVRERVAEILAGMRFPSRYVLSPSTVARTQPLVDRLKGDPDIGVREAADNADQAIRGFGSGCFGAGGGGFF